MPTEQQAEPLKLNIEGKQYELDPLSLSLDEADVIEGVVGKPLENLTEEEWGFKKVMKALVYIVISRDNPKFTWEDAGNLKLTSFQDLEDEKQPRPSRRAKGRSA